MIQFGNDKIGEIYVGSDKIKEVYYGSDLVWSGFKPSYLILTDNTRIDFDLDNTPIESFYADFDTQGYDEELEMPYLIYNINGDEVKSHKIKEVCFGSSYKDITSIGDYFLVGCSSLTSADLSPLSNITSIGDGFLNGCESLTSVDLSPFSGVTSIGDFFLAGCSSLTSVDLSPFSGVTSIGDSFLVACSGLPSVDLSPFSGVTSIGSDFLSYCSGLATLIMGAETPPTLGSSAFTDANNLSLILVPCGSESAYKSATNWIAKASIIQGNC